MWSEPSGGIKLTAYSCICWLFHRMYHNARNHKHKIINDKLYFQFDDIICILNFLQKLVSFLFVVPIVLAAGLVISVDET